MHQPAWGLFDAIKLAGSTGRRRLPDRAARRDAFSLDLDGRVTKARAARCAATCGRPGRTLRMRVAAPPALWRPSRAEVASRVEDGLLASTCRRARRGGELGGRPPSRGARAGGGSSSTCAACARAVSWAPGASRAAAERRASTARAARRRVIVRITA